MNFKKFREDYGAIILILVLHLFLLTQIKFTAWPEMLLWPYLMLTDWLPYRDIAIAHTPLLLIILKFFFGLFGIGLIQLKIFTWALILFTDILVFKIAGRLWNRKVAVLSLVFYSSLMIIYDGNGLWFDLALTPLFLLTFYFVRTKKSLNAGVFGGLAFLTKQTAAWILIPVLSDVLGKFQNIFEKRRKTVIQLEKMILGGSMIFAIFLILGIFTGILDDFWAWAIKFGVFYLPKAEGQANLPQLQSLFKAVFPFTVFLLDKNLLFWVFGGSLGVLPRWELFHFQPALPFLAFTFSVLILSEKKKWRKVPVLFITLLSLLIFIVKIASDWRKDTRFYENDVLQVANYVRENTLKDEKVLVLNAWDHFSVLTNTLPPDRPWIPQLPWYMKYSGVEEKMYTELVLNPPNIVIFHPYSESGLGSYKPEKIVNFVERYYFVDRDFGNFLVLKKR